MSAAIGLRSFDDLAQNVEWMWAMSLLCLGGCALGAWRARCTDASLSVILATAIVMRILLLPTVPSLSDDIYRYLWDGRVQNAGINPYAHAPESNAVAHLRDDMWEQINHRHVPTVYPPLAQWLFAGVVYLGGGIIQLKAAFLLCEAVTIWALIGILRQRRRDPAWVVIYAWHPLPLLEISGSGHVDALGIAALMMSLFWLGKPRRWLAAASLGAAILAKVIPIICVAAFWRHWWGQGRFRWVDPKTQLPLTATAVVVIAGYLSFLADGTDIFAGLQTYALKWRFNDGPFSIVYEVLRDPSLEWDDAALLAARKICVALWLVLMIGILRWRDPLRVSFGLLGAYVALSPTVHPWYLLWILPFLPLFPRIAWLAFSGLILLSYEVLAGYRENGLWSPAAWAWWAQYGPFFLLLVADGWRRWRTQSAPAERSLASDV